MVHHRSRSVGIPVSFLVALLHFNELSLRTGSYLVLPLPPSHSMLKKMTGFV